MLGDRHKIRLIHRARASQLVIDRVGLSLIDRLERISYRAPFTLTNASILILCGHVSILELLELHLRRHSLLTEMALKQLGGLVLVKARL